MAMILISIGELLFFKYFNFFSISISTVLNIFTVPSDPFLLNLVLPLGISFYTFVVLGYVIDVYREKNSAEHHFGKFATFVSFFPTLLSGPIERTESLLGQIHNPKSFDYDTTANGLRQMLWGFFKKIAVADLLAVYVDKVYDNITAYTGFSLVAATLLFTVQIYCDFSGYSDIAIGVAKLFNINLKENFKTPYFATSIKEFWGRWHISLSTWFRDYVYIPLGGNRVKSVRHKLNLCITFLISGLWHGANWSYVIWGAVHGIAQVVESCFRKGSKPRRFPFLRWIWTMMVVVAAWVFFRANSLTDALYVFKNCLVGIARPGAYAYSAYVALGITKDKLFAMVVGILLIILVEALQQKMDVFSKIGKAPTWIRMALYAIITLMIVLFKPIVHNSQFIYFQF